MIYSGMCGQWKPWSDCAFAQSDLGLRCPLKVLLRSVEYNDMLKSLLSDYMGLLADLYLYGSTCLKDSFYHDTAQIKSYFGFNLMRSI